MGRHINNHVEGIITIIALYAFIDVILNKKCKELYIFNIHLLDIGHKITFKFLDILYI